MMLSRRGEGLPSWREFQSRALHALGETHLRSFLSVSVQHGNLRCRVFLPLMSFHTRQLVLEGDGGESVLSESVWQHMVRGEEPLPKNLVVRMAVGAVASLGALP